MQRFVEILSKRFDENIDLLFETNFINAVNKLFAKYCKNMFIAIECMPKANSELF